MWIFSLTLDRFVKLHDVSTSHLEALVAWFFSRETAQEAGAGGRSGAAGSPVHGSLMGCFSLCKWLPSLFSWSTVALWLALWCYQVKSERSHLHKEKQPINEPWTGLPAAPDLPPAPASWAVSREKITWPRLLDERSKRREVSQNDPKWVKIFTFQYNYIS